MRSGEEYEEMAGVAGTEGEGEEARTGGETDSMSTDCGSSMMWRNVLKRLLHQLVTHKGFPPYISRNTESDREKLGEGDLTRNQNVPGSRLE